MTRLALDDHSTEALPPATGPLFTLAGFTIASEFPLAGLVPPAAAGERAPDIHIRLGDVPDALPHPTVVRHDFQFDGTDLLHCTKGVARYLIRAQREIVIAPFPSADEDAVRAFLLGKVFGLLCHMRGVMPFHACVIGVRGGCVAFAGASRAGKSTLAAALSLRGYPVIADDVCFTRPGPENTMLAWPGIRRIRLWAEAAEALGFDCALYPREVRGYNKYLIPVSAATEPDGPVTLRRFYCLAKSAEDTLPDITRLASAEAVHDLMPNVYRIRVASKIGATPAAFTACATLAQRIPVFRFSRPKRFDMLEASVDLLERHLADDL